MYEALLQKCGLTQNESLTYVALLKLGKAKSGQIVQEAKVSGGKIYETLYKLVEKGLVKIITDNGIHYFIANDPEVLITYIEDRAQQIEQQKDELKRIVPQLSALQHIIPYDNTVSMVKGMRGIRPLVYAALSAGQQIAIMGVRSSKSETFNTFWKQWHTERISQKKLAQMIFTDSGTEYWNHFEALPFTEIKAISSLSPSAIMIIDEQAFIFTYEEDMLCIHIQSKSIAKSLRTFFDSLWK